MKKIFFGILLAATMLSCQEETKQKVKVASEAVGADLKQAADSAKIGEKAKVLIGKGAEQVEKGAKKVKESVDK